VVLDTAVIVAAARSNQGASRLLLRWALEKRFVVVLSVPLALEYESVLKRPEQLAVSGGTVEQIDRLVNALIGVAIPAHRAFLRQPLLPDADDDMVLEAALSGRADLLVTFNRKHFSPTVSGWELQVVTPREAIQQIRRKNEEK
jgi:putative PIN family toxin of toxin-antitoxin system